jgi:hypothetical protein
LGFEKRFRVKIKALGLRLEVGGKKLKDKDAEIWELWD